MNNPEYSKWPVPGSGLPERIVNCSRTAGIESLGELKQTSPGKLSAIRNFGPTSLQKMQTYFQLLDRAGRTDNDSNPVPLHAIFDVFLDDDQQSVLTIRYGLDEKIDQISRKQSSLQNVANQTGRTRERIRQVEHTALQSLASRGAQLCLRPYYRHIRHTLLNSLNGTGDLPELLPTFPLSYTENRHPASLMLLLYDLNHSFFTFRNGLFSILTDKELTRLEDTLTLCLNGIKQPLSPGAILEQLPIPEINRTYPAPVLHKALLKLTAKSNALGQTRAESLCFHYSSAVPAILTHILENSHDRQLHYREITRQFNEFVIPENRKGSGFILKALQSPDFIQTSSAIYRLAEHPDS